MRNRYSLAILVLLMLPAGLDAQRRGGMFGRPRAAPLPPTAPVIAREMSYYRVAMSIESYPMVNFVEAPGFFTPGAAARWTSYGVGERMAVRLKNWVAATLDITSSPFGGYTSASTAEVGTRLGPDIWDHRIHPYADLRYGYMFAYQGYGTSTEAAIIGATMQNYRAARYSDGFGAVAGVGIEYSLTKTLMLTSGGSIMRNRMRSHQISAQTTGVGEGDYTMKSYRVTLGLRWNPVRYTHLAVQR